jgi:hypothetical protein
MKICILGTLHVYQHRVCRPNYLQNLKDLVEIHSVDLIAEEAPGLTSTYARKRGPFEVGDTIKTRHACGPYKPGAFLASFAAIDSLNNLK